MTARFSFGFLILLFNVVGLSDRAHDRAPANAEGSGGDFWHLVLGEAPARTGLGVISQKPWESPAACGNAKLN